MRSTKIAPLSLSTSYFTGSASLGISMTTLISSGTLLPVGTWSRPMGVRFLRRGGAASGQAAGVGAGVGGWGAGGGAGGARGRVRGGGVGWCGRVDAAVCGIAASAYLGYAPAWTAQYRCVHILSRIRQRARP